jgi:hypothetical protein
MSEQPVTRFSNIKGRTGTTTHLAVNNAIRSVLCSKLIAGLGIDFLLLSIDF